VRSEIWCKVVELSVLRSDNLVTITPGTTFATTYARRLSLEEVREKPSWLRSWVNSSRLQLYSHRNPWANLHLLAQPN
jgi:hypothetical protein